MYPNSSEVFVLLDDIFYQIVEDVDKLHNGLAGDDFLKIIKQNYRLSHIAYLGLNLPRQETEVYIQTTYSDKWCRRYITENYVDIDPIVDDGLRSILPLDWRTVRNKNKKVRNFFGESQQFGVGTQGLSFPIRGAHGELALFSINSHLPDSEWGDFKKEFMRDFQLLAYHFHSNVLENVVGIEIESPTLTQREKECVKWASAGKTAWETGVILGIKESTVSFFIDQVRVKLNAVNKTEAVAKAIRMKLI